MRWNKYFWVLLSPCLYKESVFAKLSSMTNQPVKSAWRVYSGIPTPSGNFQDVCAHIASISIIFEWFSWNSKVIMAAKYVTTAAFRKTFTYGTKDLTHYFPGHMARGETDFVISFRHCVSGLYQPARSCQQATCMCRSRSICVHMSFPKYFTSPSPLILSHRQEHSCCVLTTHQICQ